MGRQGILPSHDPVHPDTVAIMVAMAYLNARDIVTKNGYCGSSSHGLSIGSLGCSRTIHTVKGVSFKNWTMNGAAYGAQACFLIT